MDVGRLVKGRVCEHLVVQIRPCKRRSDRHRPAVAVDNVLFVPLERKPPDTVLAQLLVDDVRDEREVLQVTKRLGQPQGEVPRTR